MLHRAYAPDVNISTVFLPQTPTLDGLRKYRKGETIFENGQLASGVFLIVSGRVKVGFCDGQKEITKAIYEAGEIFGETALFGETRRGETATAFTDTAVRMVTVPNMLIRLRSNNDWAMHFLQMEAARRMEVQRRLKVLALLDSRSRVVDFFIQYVQQKGRNIGFEWVIYQPLIHYDIARFTATCRQTVTSVINELEARNIISFNRKRLIIRDLEKLKSEIKITY